MNAAAPGILAASRRRTLARLRAVIVLALAVPLIALCAVATYLYHQAFDDARRELNTVSDIAHEHALKLLETNEMLLARMLDLLGNASDAELLSRGAEIHERLKEMARDLPQVQGLFVNGADARSLGTSRVYPPPRQIDYSDRDWYHAHREGKVHAFVSERLVSRATGEPFFDLSRRRNFADGSFGGTVNVSLRPQYLIAFYEQFATSPGMRVALLRADGHVLARAPERLGQDLVLDAQDALVRRIAAGSAGGFMERTDSPDGARRLVSYRRVGDYPLYVAAGMDRREVLARWASGVALLSLFVLPLAISLAWMAWVGLKRTREELDAVQRLEEETARRQRTELALAHSQKLEAIGRVTGGVAHDFNNLLMIVMTNVHLLRRLFPQAGESAQLGAIDRALASGTKLTRQLLAFSRRQALRPERVVLQERLPSLLTLLRSVLGGSIELEGRVAPDAGAIHVDVAELELALINLALNAKDAMERGGRMEVLVRNAAPGEPHGLAGQFVVIEVTDTGSGIDPAHLPRVLEPFFTTKPIGKGSGLGLSQVQALSESAEGRVEIAPRPGGGTRVRMYFRRSLAALDAPVEADLADSGEELRSRVLLVEDNDAVAQASAALLAGFGCRVERVASARAALAALERTAFDVVLSDIEMPGDLDGVELAAMLARRDPPLPVVLITGYAGRLEQARTLGLEVLPKPCSAAMLRDALRRAGAKAAPTGAPA